MELLEIFELAELVEFQIVIGGGSDRGGAKRYECGVHADINFAVEY
jgi:hypothetical protein